MSDQSEPSHGRIAAMLRNPMTWVALAALLLVVAATAALAVELYASTSVPMVINAH